MNPVAQNPVTHADTVGDDAVPRVERDQVAVGQSGAADGVVRCVGDEDAVRRIRQRAGPAGDAPAEVAEDRIASGPRALEAHAAETVARDQIALTGARAADGIAGGVADGDAVLVRNRGGSGRIGADTIAGDSCAGRAAGDFDTARRVSGYQVSDNLVRIRCDEDSPAVP